MKNLHEAIQKTRETGRQVDNKGKMLCPFHNERKPSAHLWSNPHHNYQIEFHCFGCGKSMKFETFYKALTDKEYRQKEFRREDLHVDLDLLSSRTHLQFLRLLEDEEFGNSYPEEANSARTALGYLEKRGFSIETVKSHQIGFIMREQAENQNGVRDTSWVRNKKRYCFLTFPVRNQKGKVYTMQFEDFPNRERRDDTKLNLKGRPLSLWYSQTPDSESKKNEEWVVCESIYDALSFSVVGVKAIATLGPPSDKKIEELTEFKHLLLALDNDEGGKGAKNKFAKKLYFHTGSLKEVVYPEGVKDPNELLQREGSEGIMSLLEKARDVDLFPPLIDTIDVMVEDYNRLLEEAIAIPQEFYFLKEEGFLKEGLVPGLYALAGIPGVGKTTLLNQLADSLAKIGIPTVYFLTEEPAYRLLQRTVKKEGLEHMTQIKDNQPDILSYRRVFEMLPEYTAEELKDILQGIKLKLKAEGEHHPVFILDSLQALRLSKENEKLDIREKSILKTELLSHIARDLMIPVIFTSFIPRRRYPGENNKKLTVAIFKESGDIEYLIDVGMCLWVEKQEDLKEDIFQVSLSFLKNRFGRWGSVGLRLIKEECRFERDNTNQQKNF